MCRQAGAVLSRYKYKLSELLQQHHYKGHPDMYTLIKSLNTGPYSDAGLQLTEFVPVSVANVPGY